MSEKVKITYCPPGYAYGYGWDNDSEIRVLEQDTSEILGENPYAEEKPIATTIRNQRKRSCDTKK